jgi:hypothetical protein
MKFSKVIMPLNVTSAPYFLIYYSFSHSEMADVQTAIYHLRIKSHLGGVVVSVLETGPKDGWQRSPSPKGGRFFGVGSPSKFRLLSPCRLCSYDIFLNEVRKYHVCTSAVSLRKT